MEINLLTLTPGMRVLLADGSLVEVVENPGDGLWLFGRYLRCADATKLGGDKEHAIFAQDVVEIAAPEAGG